MCLAPAPDFVDCLHFLAPAVELFSEDVDRVVAVLDDLDEFALGELAQVFVSLAHFGLLSFNVCVCLLCRIVKVFA